LFKIQNSQEIKKKTPSKQLKNRINKNIPAVTKVLEWTKAETGVGAAIASGNQLENGNWALFVKQPNIKNINKIFKKLKLINNQLPCKIKIPNPTIKNPSPKRFII